VSTYEIVADGTQPTSYCSHHVKVKVCLDAGKDKNGKYILAGPNCTHIEEVVTSRDNIASGSCTVCKPAAQTPDPAATPAPTQAVPN
jgi:hypothetical protein